MGKTTPEQLAEWITEELVTYLGAGQFNPQQLAAAIDYSNLQIESFDELKQLHFVLHDDVVSYIEALPKRLRRVKSVNKRAHEVAHGEIRGQIDWQRTFQERPRRGNDPSIFVVDNPEIAYDIPENRVVKKLLAAIVEPLSRDLNQIEQEWRSEWGKTDIRELERILAQNVYLDALPAPKEIAVTNRDLETARRARQPLYKKGQALYRLYQDLMNNRFDRPGVKKLLKETIVTPTQDYKLFELFCLFGEIHRREPGLTWRRIQPTMDEVAILESETRRLEVYYDQNGPLTFFEGYPRPAQLEDQDVPEMIHRQAAALEAHSSILGEFLERETQQSFYSGRPDFLLLDYEVIDGKEQIQEVILGEVKYTRSPSTFSKGLRELLEYVHFAQQNTDYLFGDRAVSVTGVLCTDGVETKTDRSSYIEHHTTQDLQQQFSI